MKKVIFLLLPFSVLTYLVTINPFDSANADQLDTSKVILPRKDHAQVELLVTSILNKYHYRKQDLNDSLSQAIFDNYIESLDGNHLYFTQGDINDFVHHRDKFDDYLQNGVLEPAYDIFNVYRKRFYERLQYVDQVLTSEFNFEDDEFYLADRENEPWAQNKEELDEVWRKMLKYQALNHKLTGKEWPEIVKILNKRFDNYEKSISQIKSEDVFQTYMNAFSESYDPHTNYFSPIAYDNFMVGMKQSLEGIGARLQIENDYTMVQEIIVGGPAYKSKKINKNDKIVGVAQGEEGEMVDVIGWRLDEVVKLIRGPKGSVVRLQIIPGSLGANALPIEIELVRDRIKIEDQAASKKIHKFQKDDMNYKLAVITIPSFYLEFDEAGKSDDYNSTTRDVRKLLEEAKQEDVDGVLIDLRLNGGGSLTEAIELTGLFIENGPVVQVKNTTGKVDVAEDPDPNIVYAGPLAVLVNRFSASASEIFAGAIQDYGRGVVIGEQTFGKGTVQNLIDLDKFVPDKDNDFGNVKITLAKFYRITGSSTQHRGVTPDIELPSAFSAEEYGESSHPSALPWDQIESTNYDKLNFVDDKLLTQLRSNYAKRLETDTDLQELIDEINKIKGEREDNLISLNEEKRKLEMDEAEANRTAHLRLSGEMNPEIDDDEDDGEIEDTYLKEGFEILTELITYTMG